MAKCNKVLRLKKRIYENKSVRRAKNRELKTLNFGSIREPGKLFRDPFAGKWAWWALLGILIVTASIRYGLLDVPLERDEGEYAYAAQLILSGIPPYVELYNMKLPGMYAAYAAIMTIFGQTHRGIHLGLLVVNLATIIMIFLLIRRFINSFAAIVSSASYAVLSLSQSVHGIFANAEHFVILSALTGLVLMLKAMEENKHWILFLSGLALGTGFLMKQHGAAFVAFGGVCIIIGQFQKGGFDLRRLGKHFVLFMLGSIIPYGITCLILLYADVFQKFWLWTVSYAMAYTTRVPVEYAWTNLMDRAGSIIGSAPLLWVLSGLGIIALSWDRKLRSRLLLIILFILFSFASICPGFYFRPHYFVLILPCAALLIGLAASFLAEKIPKSCTVSAKFGVPALIVAICLAVSIYQQRLFLFQMTPAEACRATYGYNPFPESLEIARYIQEHTDKDKRVAVIGSEPQIYFYSKRRSASGYIYMYPLMEDHKFALQMQTEMISEIESVKPEYLIYVNISYSWLRRPDSHKLLFKWLQGYLSQNYKLVGLVELLKEKSIFHWAPDVKWPPESHLWITILKREIESAFSQ